MAAAKYIYIYQRRRATTVQHPPSQVHSQAKWVNVFKTQMEKYKSYCSEKNGEPRNLITESKGTLLKKHGAKF